MIARADRDTLLCESCGYDLDGLAPSGSCPECDRPITGSLPARRSGSPWQQRESAGGWAAAGARTLRAPLASWSVVRVDGRASDRLTTVNLLVAACMVGSGLASFAEAHRAADGGVLAWLPVALAGAAVAYGVLLVCVSIESIGVQVFGRRNGWRVTPDVAAAVVGHASVGWLVGATLFFVAAPLAGLLGEALVPAFSAIATSSAIIGLLAFETLVYVGVRRMRFANPPSAVSPTSPAAP